jgi:hypothetical protein
VAAFLTFGVTVLAALLAAAAHDVAKHIPLPWSARAVVAGNRHLAAAAVASALTILGWASFVASGAPYPLVGLVLGFVAGLSAARLAVVAGGAWERERQLWQRLPLPPLPPVRTAEFAGDIDRVELPRVDLPPTYRITNGARRVRSAAAAMLVVMGASAYATQLRFGPDSDAVLWAGAAVLAVLVVYLGVSGVIRARLLWQARRALDATSLDAELFEPGDHRLPKRFPRVPFARGPRGRQVTVAHRTLVGRSGGWRWWVHDETALLDHKRIGAKIEHTVVVVWLPGVRLPELQILARHAAAAEDWLRGPRFELEAFNRNYFVRTPDSRYASNIVTPRMMEHVMTRLPEGGVLGTAGDSAYLVVPGRLASWSPEQLVASCVGAAQLIPRHVLSATRDQVVGTRPGAY